MVFRVTPALSTEAEMLQQNTISAEDNTSAQPKRSRGRDGDADAQRAIEHIAKIDDLIWIATARAALSDFGPQDFQKHVKERYLLDCTVWGVSAALFATIGVSFLLLGPTNFRQEDMDERWHKVLTYVYVAACVGVILANANAVLVASVTYALSSVVPERRFIEWLARKTQNGLGRNVSVWVLAGSACMLLCIVLAATLLHGWPMGVLAAGVSVLLYGVGQMSSLSIFQSYVAMTKEEEAIHKS